MRCSDAFFHFFALWSKMCYLVALLLLITGSNVLSWQTIYFTRGRRIQYYTATATAASSSNDFKTFNGDNNNEHETKKSISPEEFASSLEEQAEGAVVVSKNIIDAASIVTRKSIKLLGVKSIGVDYGLVRTGIAVTVGFDPKPLAILKGLNATTKVAHEKIAQEIIQYCSTERAAQIVVGLPLHKNGTEAEQTNITRAFATQLAVLVLERLGPKTPVYMFDERYTSKEAAARAHSEDPDKYLYGTLDAEAACIILEHFYQDNGNGAQLVEVPTEVRESRLEIYRRDQTAKERRFQSERRQRDRSPLGRRKEAMERAQRIEAELEKNGWLGTSQKKKKKKKRKPAKRGHMIFPKTRS